MFRRDAFKYCKIFTKLTLTFYTPILISWVLNDASLSIDVINSIFLFTKVHTRSVPKVYQSFRLPMDILLSVKLKRPRYRSRSEQPVNNNKALIKTKKKPLQTVMSSLTTFWIKNERSTSAVHTLFREYGRTQCTETNQVHLYRVNKHIAQEI